ncbi:MAG: discoidin domain-containing protein, partial [Lentisphaerota bacterium]
MNFKKIMLVTAMSFVSTFAAVSAEKNDNPVPTLPAETPRDIPSSRISSVTASTVRMPQFSPDKAIDGNPSSGWQSELGSIKTKGPQWLMLELEEVYPVDALRYYLSSNPQEPSREYANWICRIQDYEIQVSADGKEFKTVASGTWDKKDLKEQRAVFPAVKAKFVKLICKAADRDGVSISELRIESPEPPQPKAKPVKEQPKASAANTVKDQEITKVLPPPRVPVTTVRDIPISRLKASATSHRNDYTVPSKAVDGDLSQGWLSELGSLKSKGPQSLTLEMDNVYTVDALRYFLNSTPQTDPKREYVNWISRIQKYEISVSIDGKTFQSVASGEWDKTDLNEQRVSFTPVQARFVKLTAFVGGNDNAGATEVSLESPNPPKPLGTVVPPPANAATRRAAFEQRDNMDWQKEIVRRLTKMVQRNNPELSAFFAANDKGDATAALAAFNRAVISRMKKFAPLLDVEKPTTPPMGIPEEMLANIISAPQLKSKFDVGEPGAIYWNAPEILAEVKAKGNRALSPEMFDPLLASYRQFGNESYFQKWAAYMDDMLLNDRGYRDMNSFNMMDQDCWGPRRIRWLFTQLLQVENARPGSLEHLPIGLLPRIFTEMVPDHIALGAAYFHANAQNWTHHATVEWLKAGAFLDGLIVMDVPLTERTLRMRETYETCSNLPEGTEAEQAMWYNWGWVGSVLELLHTLDAIGRIEPSCISLDAARRAEIEESFMRRIRYCAQIYTQQGEWPLFLRGDNRKLWGLGSLKKDNHELHGGAGMQPLGSYNERVLNDPAIAPVLSAIGPEKETGVVPSYTSNYFPWGGYRIIRENWDPQSQYGSMFSSPKPGKYWARGGSDQLNFGLHAFGQDLLVDDAKGHYSGFSSPVMVDGKNQAYRVGYPVWGHKQILLNGWEKPDSSRFLSSPALEFMEGTYSGPYGEANAERPEEIAAENAAAIRGVVHGRQIIFIRESGLWIVI